MRDYSSRREYISREKLDDFFDKHIRGYENCPDKYDATIELKAASHTIPAADVREVRRGKWIPDDETGLPICSNCFSGKPKSCVCTSVIDHHLHNKEIRYCYFCGADMREEQT